MNWASFGKGRDEPRIEDAFILCSETYPLPELHTELMKEKRKRPRICFAVPHFPKYFPGGAEIQSYFIARHMLGKGWSVHFTTEDREDPAPRLENEDGIWVHKLKRTRFLNPIKCWSFYRELLRIDADIYYQRGGTEYTFVTSLAAKALGKKFVWATSSIPDCEGNKFRGSLRDEGVKGIKRLLLFPDARIRDALVSCGRRRADSVIVQDQSQHVRMKTNFRQEAVVIKTGHPIPESPGEKDRPPLVVWIANVKRLKRPEMFVQLAQACSDLQARFLLVGGRADPPYRRRLMKRSAGLNNLEVKWAVPFHQTNEILSSASLLVNTSTREGFPNTFVQAWLRETPVVSLAVDPDGVLARERIGVRSGTFRQMVEDVRRLIGDESFREEMGKRARAYAVREHNLADKLERYAHLLENLCRERSMVQPA